LHTLDWKVFLSLSTYHFYFSELLTPIGEEIGWRGYALPRLQNRFGSVWASILIGLMWAGFVLPALTLVQMWPFSGLVMYGIALVALSVEMTFAMNISGLSIIVAVAMNTLAAAQSGYLAHALIAHSQPRPHWEWIASLSNLLVPAFLIIATRGRLGARSPSQL
jgi:glycopeptide antibiotics resistance protein